ncbi:MAG TPA: hypothetical protein DD675_16805 [Raoultella ornithinolytica]|nr:hypothetical protein [Raoultella ornithinolytica]
MIVTSCYIANINSTFFIFYRQVKTLNCGLGKLSDSESCGLRPHEWAAGEEKRWAKKRVGMSSGKTDNIDGEPAFC